MYFQFNIDHLIKRGFFLYFEVFNKRKGSIIINSYVLNVFSMHVCIERNVFRFLKVFNKYRKYNKKFIDKQK